MKRIMPYILIFLLLIGMISQQYYINSIKENFIILINKVQELIEPKPDFDKLKLATIQIKKGRAGCAGIIYKIDEKYLYILTVKHLLKVKGDISMWIYNSKKEIVEIKKVQENIYKNKKVDLLLIKIVKPEEKFVFISLAKYKPNIGDKIYTIGHPFGKFYYSINTGLVTNYVKRAHQNIKGNYMSISAPTYRGNSGGAVVNCNNELVGIIIGTMYLYKNQFKTEKEILHNIAFAVRLEDIKRFLEEVK